MPILDPVGNPIVDTDTELSDVDAATATAMAMEIRQKALDGPAVLSLDPLTALQVAGLVQLALRHPDTTGSPAAVGRAFVDGIREYFEDAPTVLDILRRGDDPAEDR